MLRIHRCKYPYRSAARFLTSIQKFVLFFHRHNCSHCLGSLFVRLLLDPPARFKSERLCIFQGIALWLCLSKVQRGSSKVGHGLLVMAHLSIFLQKVRKITAGFFYSAVLQVTVHIITVFYSSESFQFEI